MSYTQLFQPLEIGSTTVPNRFMTTAISHDLWRFDPEGYHRWNMLGSRAMHFYAERAKGGFGLITAGQAMVHPSCGTNRPAAFLSEVIDEYRPITDAVHEHGSRIFMQLNHNGRGRISGTDDWAPVLTARSAPSFYPGAGGELTKEIDTWEIDEIVEGWAVSARNMQRAGFDGVEIHAAHSYLLSEFLTPAYNRRSDEYGGSLENRMRFLLRVLAAVRKAVGSEFTVGIRLNAEWKIPDGFTPEDSIEVARRLDGQVDFINLSAWGYDIALQSLGTPQGNLIPHASKLKAALSGTPIFVVHRIVDADMANSIIADGHADMVAMGRQSIADPEYPNKLREGRRHDIVRCIGASQGCIGRHYQHMPITCTQNPAVGREAELGIGTLRPAPRRKRVLVVGGGPAGMEAAIVAAQRGHEVILCERAAALGGQVNLIRRLPRRAEFGYVVEDREGQIERLGIEVRLSTKVDASAALELGADAVVVATGSMPRVERPEGHPGHWTASRLDSLGIPGAELDHVYTPWDVLEGRLDAARHVVVLDGNGYYQSSDPVEYLLARDVRVSALSLLGIFASDMLYNDRPGFVAALHNKPVSFHPWTAVREIHPNTVDALDTQTGRSFSLTDVDAVVLSVGSMPRNALYYELKERTQELHRIGDCITPRRVEHAHFEGRRVGRAV